MLNPWEGRPIGCLAPVAPKSLLKSMEMPPAGGGGIVVLFVRAYSIDGLGTATGDTIS